ncbi:MAG: glutamine-hydrolyzing GMP synthase subunit GuaA, partial [Oscillospiraceae bacterium]|nr:glutamine-hydrolyzing GMP synthase subunit GuaA [Oscillospiraceae bacterium]
FKSTGIKDGKRAFQWPCIIRAVNTKDAMQATVERVDYEVLERITYRITHEVPSINRVLYDLTPKPTATIEYE